MLESLAVTSNEAFLFHRAPMLELALSFNRFRFRVKSLRVHQTDRPALERVGRPSTFVVGTHAVIKVLSPTDIEAAIGTAEDIHVAHWEQCPSTSLGAPFASHGGALDMARWPAMSVRGRAHQSTFPASRMVEAPGVEPGSEDRQHNGSTCVADRFSFAATHAHRLA